MATLALHETGREFWVSEITHARVVALFTAWCVRDASYVIATGAGACDLVSGCGGDWTGHAGGADLGISMGGQYLVDGVALLSRYILLWYLGHA